jgi:glycosyltransferase involved in cell wall biosynthesis
MGKRVLIVCFNKLHNDPRILRQVKWLRDRHDVTTLGFSPTGIDGISHIACDPPGSNLSARGQRLLRLAFKDYEELDWNAGTRALLKETRKEHFDVIIANDIDTLPLAVESGRGRAKIVFDAHEYAPLECEESLRWRTLNKPYVDYRFQRYFKEVSVAMTVCQGIADLYEQDFGKKFEVITNAAEYSEVKPSVINPQKIKLIYHGHALPSRRTDKQIDLMRFLNKNFELNLMLARDASYIKQLKDKARSFSNINFLPPVEFSKIVSTINQFDIGLFVLPPVNVNYRLALPNKFFEFIQGRLAVAVSPSIEMARITKNYDLGVVADDFEPESMANALNSLSVEVISNFKERSDKAAHELSAEKNGEKFLKLVEN